MTFSKSDIPYLSEEQMREVDRAMIEDFGIALMQMMENAGRALARLAVERFLSGDANARAVVVLAGSGGNGGGGLVCARRLHSWGAKVEVFLSTSAGQLGDVPAHQLKIARHMGIPVGEGDVDISLPPADLVIDALIGYSLRGAPTGASAALIRAANAHVAPVLSLDVPSGLEASTGAVHDPSITATATLTLALPKEGLRAGAAKSSVGELYLADIGVPPDLYSAPGLGLEVGPIFSQNEIIRIW